MATILSKHLPRRLAATSSRAPASQSTLLTHHTSPLLTYHARLQPQHPPSTRSHSTYSSVNASEISHFDSLASTWWDGHGPSRLLHLMNPPRHAFIRTCLSSQPDTPPPTLSYLDVGCGGGIFAESAARLNTTSHVLAIDASEEVLAVARGHARRDPALRGRLAYRKSSIEDLGEELRQRVEAGKESEMETGQFDVVSVFEVVEHVDEPAKFLDRCAPLVKPGGWLVLSTIARTWMSWFTTNLMAEDVLRIVPKGTHSWEKYINEEELRSYFASKGGWNSPMVQGVVYMPGLGWKVVPGSEKVGNYFFGVRKDGP